MARMNELINESYCQRKEIQAYKITKGKAENSNLILRIITN